MSARPNRRSVLKRLRAAAQSPFGPGIARLLNPGGLAVVAGLLLLAALVGPMAVQGQDQDVVAESEAVAPSPPVTPEEPAAAETPEQIHQRLEELQEQLEELEEVGYELEVVTDIKRRHRIRKDTQVVFGRSVHVEENETAEDVVAIGGSIYLNGEVRGDAVAVGGSAHVEGLVKGDVVAVGGTVHVGPNAEIMGEAVSIGGTVEYEDGAQIHGQVTEVPIGDGVHIGMPHIGMAGMGMDWGDHEPVFRLFGFIWSLIGLGLLFLFAALILMLFRTPVERVVYRATTDPWKSGFVGLVSQILFVPLLVVTVLVLVISIIGIPLLILLPFVFLGLCLMSLLGYTAVAYRLGRWAEERFGWNVDSPYVALLIGVLGVQIWCLAGELLDVAGGFLWFFSLIFGLIGFLVSYLVWTVGFGAALMTRFGTTGPFSGDESASMSLPPVPSTPSASEAVSPGGAAVAEELSALVPEASSGAPETEAAPGTPDLPQGWEPEPAPTGEEPPAESSDDSSESGDEGGEEVDPDRR